MHIFGFSFRVLRKERHEVVDGDVIRYGLKSGEWETSDSKYIFHVDEVVILTPKAYNELMIKGKEAFSGTADTVLLGHS